LKELKDYRIILLAICFFAPVAVQAQQDTVIIIDSDTSAGTSRTNAEKEYIRSLNKDARKSMYKSMLVPGWGQVSNGQWWKTPIIYAGLGTCIYFIDYNNDLYLDYRDSYRKKNDPSYDGVDNYPLLSASQVQTRRNEFRRNRDLVIIIGSLVYIANILDAYVYAHLKTFDISDDLSLKFNAPQLHYNFGSYYCSAGITINLKP